MTQRKIVGQTSLPVPFRNVVARPSFLGPQLIVICAEEKAPPRAIEAGLSRGEPH